MKPSCHTPSHACDNFILFAASFLVPASKRAEWRREWQAELFQVRRTFLDSDSFSFPAQREITAFCAGSFQDALCVRHLSSRPSCHGPTSMDQRRSASAFLAVALAALSCCSRALSRCRCGTGFWTLSGQSRLDISSRPTKQETTSRRLSPLISFALGRQVAIDTLIGSLSIAPSRNRLPLYCAFRAWQVTHASSNLFSLLGLKIDFAAAARRGKPANPQVILSHETWTRDFAADPRIAGRVIQFGHQSAKVAGVLPYGSWRLPGQPDAWLLEGDSQLAPAPGRPLWVISSRISPSW